MITLGVKKALPLSALTHLSRRILTGTDIYGLIVQTVHILMIMSYLFSYNTDAVTVVLYNMMKTLNLMDEITVDQVCTYMSNNLTVLV